MKRVSLCVSLILGIFAPTDVWASLADARKELRAGNYEIARKRASALTGADFAAAQRVIVTAYLHTGRYDEAEAVASGLAARSQHKVAGTVLHAEVLRVLGKGAAAIPALRAITQKDAKQLRARWLLAWLEYERGHKDVSDALFERFFSDYNAGLISNQDAQALFYVASAAHRLGAYEDANDTFREVFDLDPTFHEATLGWAALGLEKYAVSIADSTLKDILKANPRHPLAHVGMARLKLDNGYDLKAVTSHVEKAFAVNPKSLGGRIVNAIVAIDRKQWSAAEQQLAQVLAINPHHLEALSLRAAMAWIRDDTKAYAAELKRIFAINPRYASVYHTIARFAVHEHRYAQAIKLEKQAVKLAPEFYAAMGEIGSGYLRLGQEKEGLQWLRKAWSGDEYNVRTYNLLNLFDKEIPQQYSFLQTKHFRIRVPNNERAMVKRFVVPLLERGYAEFVRRYRFRPAQPIVWEIYRNSEHYSVRTVGLPNLGALGVCFGRVVTTMSPTAAPINWAMVYWHELSHVFHVQASKSRVPRWFTEGLAEYETMRARPHWRREHDTELARRLRQGTLPSVVALNAEFMKPDNRAVVVAYHLAAVVMEYLATEHGFDAVVKALGLYGQGMETRQVIPKVSGRSIAQFDADFARYLRGRLRPFLSNFWLAPVDESLGELSKMAAAAPKNYRLGARLAQAYAKAGKFDAAVRAADDVLLHDARNRRALFLKAELALRNKKLVEARGFYRRLIKAKGDSYEARLRLAVIAEKRHEMAGLRKQLITAKRLDPERAAPYLRLHKVYADAGNKRAALKELETYVMLEQMQYKPLIELVNGYADRKRWGKVRTYGELALEQRYNDAALHLRLGDSYRHLGQTKRAVFAYESALQAQPRLRRPALAHLGIAKAYLKTGARKRARQAVVKALTFEPQHAELLKLRAQLPD